MLTKKHFMFSFLSKSFSKPKSTAIFLQRTMVNKSSASGGTAPNRSTISAWKFTKSASVSQLSNLEYKLNLSVMLSTYLSGIKISRSVSNVQSFTKSSCLLISSLNNSLKLFRFNSRTASSKIFWYISNPISEINPLCSPPSMLPAPRISKSRMAIWKPLPKSLYCSNVDKRFLLSVGSVLIGGASR